MENKRILYKPTNREGSLTAVISKSLQRLHWLFTYFHTVLPGKKPGAANCIQILFISIFKFVVYLALVCCVACMDFCLSSLNNHAIICGLVRSMFETNIYIPSFSRTYCIEPYVLVQGVCL